MDCDSLPYLHKRKIHQKVNYKKGRNQEKEQLKFYVKMIEKFEFYVKMILYALNLFR